MDKSLKSDLSPKILIPDFTEILLHVYQVSLKKVNLQSQKPNVQSRDLILTCRASGVLFLDPPLFVPVTNKEKMQYEKPYHNEFL